MKNKNHIRGLGAAMINHVAFLFFSNKENKRTDTFTIRTSKDGIHFSHFAKEAKILNLQGPSDDFSTCSLFRVSQDAHVFYLTYYIAVEHKMCIARSKNLIDWEKITEINQQNSVGKIVSDYLYAGRAVMFCGGDGIYVYVSEDYKKWSRIKKSIISSNKEQQITIIEVQIVEGGIFVLYDVKDTQSCDESIIYGILLQYGNPTKVVWQSKKPIYTTQNKKQHRKDVLVGVVVFDEYFISYWTNGAQELFLLKHFYKQEKVDIDQNKILKNQTQKKQELLKLERVSENPILEPCCDHTWEAKATYNPTAFVYNDVTHIIYRADGHDLLSVWGYATSFDGITIEERLPYYIYKSVIQCNISQKEIRDTQYCSGNNSCGGCEDPRAVLIDDTVYVTYTAFDGWGSIRVALASISLENVLQKKWDWHRRVIISPPGEMNKNWVLFPEKINGKYAILHAFYPDILIEYIDDLNIFDGETHFIHSNNTRPLDPTRGWDSWFRGVGPAPLRTEDGWLILYHAMDHKSPDRYKLGALLLDFEDPTHVLYRSVQPILEPQTAYENDGLKWGVVYCCGAVIKNDTLFVYYGGSDTVVCVATANIHTFLDDLKRTGVVKMIIS